MLSKIKKIFFNGMFGLMYALFVYLCVVAIYGMIGRDPRGDSPMELGFLAFVWLALIAARYLSKKSAGLGKPHEGGYHGGGHYRR